MKATRQLPTSSDRSASQARVSVSTSGTGSDAESAEESPEEGEEEEEEEEPAASDPAPAGDEEEEEPAAGAQSRQPGRLRGLTALVSTAMRSREGLRADLQRARAENDSLRRRLAAVEAENSSLRDEVADHRELVDQLEQLEAEQRTTSQGVRAELEAIGIADADAPAADSEAGGASIQELEARLDNETDPEKAAALYRQIKDLEGDRAA